MAGFNFSDIFGGRKLPQQMSIDDTDGTFKNELPSKPTAGINNNLDQDAYQMPELPAAKDMINLDTVKQAVLPDNFSMRLLQDADLLPKDEFTSVKPDKEMSNPDFTNPQDNKDLDNPGGKVDELNKTKDSGINDAKKNLKQPAPDNNKYKEIKKRDGDAIVDKVPGPDTTTGKVTKGGNEVSEETIGKSLPERLLDWYVAREKKKAMGSMEQEDGDVQDAEKKNVEADKGLPTPPPDRPDNPTPDSPKIKNDIKPIKGWPLLQTRVADTRQPPQRNPSTKTPSIPPMNKASKNPSTSFKGPKINIPKSKFKMPKMRR